MSEQWLEKLYISKQLSDVTFVVEGEEIPAHRIILAANCEYFKIMLFGDTNEAGMKTVVLKETPLKPFREVIRSIYLRRVDLSGWEVDDVLRLLGLAHEYQLSPLAQIAVSAMDHNLFTLETVGKFFEIATIYDFQPLVNRCLDYTDNHSKEVFENLGVFCTYSANFVKQMLDRSTLIEKETLILEAVWTWQQDRPIEERRVVLSKIRWDCLSHQHCFNLINLLLTRSEDAFGIVDWYKELEPASKRRKPVLNCVKIKSLYSSPGNSLVSPPYEDLFAIRTSFLFPHRWHSNSYEFLTINLEEGIVANQMVFDATAGGIVKVELNSRSTNKRLVENSDCPSGFETYEVSFDKLCIYEIKIYYFLKGRVRMNGLRLFIAA